MGLPVFILAMLFGCSLVLLRALGKQELRMHTPWLNDERDFISRHDDKLAQADMMLKRWSFI